MIPFNATASAILPDANIENVFINGKTLIESALEAQQKREAVCVELSSGIWEVNYVPTKEYIKQYSTHSNIGELWDNEEVRKVLESTTY